MKEKIKAKVCIAITPQLDVTSRIGSHSVTFCPIQLYTRPALTASSKLVLDVPTPEGWKAELT